MVKAVRKYRATIQRVNRVKVISAEVFPSAAQSDRTIERKRKYTKVMSQSGARNTSLYLNLFSSIGITVSDIEGVKFRHGTYSKYDRP
jgi:hypothetical protein